MVPLDKTAPPRRIPHRLIHPQPDGFQLLARHIAKTERGKIARANLPGGVDVQVLRARTATKKLRTFDLIKCANLGAASAPIGLDVKVAPTRQCVPALATSRVMRHPVGRRAWVR